jgi:hypothetical protein
MNPKPIKTNLADMVAKAQKAFRTSEAIKRSAAELQKMSEASLKGNQGRGFPKPK